MWTNYLKATLRAFGKHKLYGFINVLGLGLGLACCLLLLLFVRDELRYDRFHEHAERTYRIVQQDEALAADVTPEAPLAPILAAEFPEVEHATRLFRYWFTPLVSLNDAGFYEDDLFFTDAAFFDVFSFRLQRGDPARVLAEPFSLVLTASAARKYFGDADPVGRTLTLNAQHSMTVTGVLDDPPRTSHLDFDMLASVESLPAVMNWPDVLESWGLGAFPTYLVLAEGTTPEALEAKLPGLVDRVLGEDSPSQYTLQPLTDIHLHSDYRGEISANSDVRYVVLLLALAAAILLLACVNYTNLATARFAQRAKEIGVRKAVGAQRRQLAGQFLAESLLTATLALGAALTLLALVLPAFDVLVGGAPTLDGTMLLLAASATALTGLFAGLYPALVLSAPAPRVALLGDVQGGRPLLRQALVVAQYAIAIVLIVGTGVIFQQLDYVRTERLGFDRTQTVVLPVRDEAVRARPGVATAAFTALPDVTHASATTSLPGTQFPGTTDLAPEGMTREPFRIFLAWIDDGYLDALGAELAAGRNVSAERASDSSGAVLLNETAVREIGWASAEEALGRRVGIWGQEREVVGVVRDFHYASLREPIGPLLFFPEFGHADGLVLRLRTDDLPATMRRLDATWQELSTAQPFTYSFLDRDLDRLYASEERWGRLIGAGAFLALLIACLGLFGLASFTAAQRTKEVGVRKVLGASAASIVLLLSRDFARLVGVAFVVGVPLAYAASRWWLDDFAYRTALGTGVFLLAGALVLLIALLTVSYQAIRAALADPVQSLRYE